MTIPSLCRCTSGSASVSQRCPTEATTMTAKHSYSFATRFSPGAFLQDRAFGNARKHIFAYVQFSFVQVWWQESCVQIRQYLHHRHLEGGEMCAVCHLRLHSDHLEKYLIAWGVLLANICALVTDGWMWTGDHQVGNGAQNRCADPIQNQPRHSPSFPEACASQAGISTAGMMDTCLQSWCGIHTRLAFCGEIFAEPYTNILTCVEQLKQKADLIEALKEIKMQEDSTSFLDPEYAKIIDNREKILREFKVLFFIFSLFSPLCRLLVWTCARMQWSSPGTT